MKKLILILLLIPIVGISQLKQLPIRLKPEKSPHLQVDSCIGISQDSIKIYMGKRGGLYILHDGKKHYLKKGALMRK
jgi:hypothetical protein